MIGEAVETFGPAAGMAVARLERLEDRLMERQLGLAVPTGEPHRDHRLVTGRTPALACIGRPDLDTVGT